MDVASKSSPEKTGGPSSNSTPEKTGGLPSNGSPEKTSGLSSNGSPEKKIGQAPTLFPDSVGFRENDPKQGFVYIIINIPGVMVSSSFTSGGRKVKPLNVTLLDEANLFQQKSVCLKLNVSHSDGKVQQYEYKKALVKPIEPKASLVKFEKNGQIKLRIKKVDPAISWAPFAQYLTTQDEPTE